MPPDRRSRRREVAYRAQLPHTSPVEYWEVAYDSLAEALHFACRDLRAKRRIPLEIRADGALLYDAHALVIACRERGETPTTAQEVP